MKVGRPFPSPLSLSPPRPARCPTHPCGFPCTSPNPPLPWGSRAHSFRVMAWWGRDPTISRTWYHPLFGRPQQKLSKHTDHQRQEGEQRGHREHLLMVHLVPEDSLTSSD